VQCGRPYWSRKQQCTCFLHGNVDNRSGVVRGVVESSCMGKISTAPKLPKTLSTWYLYIAGVTDASAVNPGSAIAFSFPILSVVIEATFLSPGTKSALPIQNVDDPLTAHARVKHTSRILCSRPNNGGVPHNRRTSEDAFLPRTVPCAGILPFRNMSGSR